MTGLTRTTAARGPAGQPGLSAAPGPSMGAGGLGSAVKNVGVVVKSFKLGAGIAQDVQKAVAEGKTFESAVVCETVGNVVEVGTRKVIKASVLGSGATLAAIEPWALPPVLPVLTDTWGRAPQTAGLFGSDARDRCYSLFEKPLDFSKP